MSHIIETERLLLRAIDAEKDFTGWAELMGDEQSARHIGGQLTIPGLVWRNMAMVIGHTSIRGYGFMSVIEKATGTWVGRVGPWNPLGWVQPEVGWAIHPAHTRKGFATEAGAACLTYAFETLGWQEIAHVIHHENLPSMKTAEKLGSTRLRTLEGIPGLTTETCYVYGQSRK